MKPRTFARRPSSIGSNQLSKSRSSASPVQAVVVLLVMAWSPVRRSNAGISRVANPGDYATPNSNHLRDGTSRTLRSLTWTRLTHPRETSARTQLRRGRRGIGDFGGRTGVLGVDTPFTGV